jgi:hypothetical protein
MALMERKVLLDLKVLLELKVKEVQMVLQELKGDRDYADSMEIQVLRVLLELEGHRVPMEIQVLRVLLGLWESKVSRVAPDLRVLLELEESRVRLALKVALDLKAQRVLKV